MRWASRRSAVGLSCLRMDPLRGFAPFGLPSLAPSAWLADPDLRAALAANYKKTKPNTKSTMCSGRGAGGLAISFTVARRARNARAAGADPPGEPAAAPGQGAAVRCTPGLLSGRDAAVPAPGLGVQGQFAEQAGPAGGSIGAGEPCLGGQGNWGCRQRFFDRTAVTLKWSALDFSFIPPISDAAHKGVTYRKRGRACRRYS